MSKFSILFDKCKKNKEVFFYLNDSNTETLPKEISELTHLKILDLRNNCLKKLPSEIGELRNLEILDLRSNKLEELPYEISFLNKLEELNLQNNRITELPVEIINLSSLKRINLEGNPITKPPIEVVAQGIGAIKNYFNSIVNSDENIKLFEAKLLIVGEGNVGKTCLVQSILNQSKKTKTTEGIDIKQWKLDNNENIDYRINIWDFGGQEIYHSTHQFFLTKRSMYVFVWTARTDDNLLSFDYWLNIIKLLGDNPPVFIVLNKIDERIKNIDEALIKSKFNNIVGFHKISAINNTNVQELIDSVKDSLKSLDHLGDTLPKVWNDIRTNLESVNEETISLEEYLEICKNYSLTDKQALFLSQYYHDIGVFLHFQDNSILKNIVFLKPEWATNAVYKLIDAKHVISNYGKFSFSELSQFWSDYPSRYYTHLIELMKKFELCFNLNDSENYIIPELLNNQTIIYELPFPDILSLRYKYEFMPKGIITRLIVRLHDIIKGELYWKNGLVIVREGTEAKISSDKFSGLLDINIGGYDRNGMLSIISREIEYIHKSLNYPIVDKLIPCVCVECVKSQSPHYFSYQVLKKYQEKNKNVITCPISIDEIKIETAIKGIEGNLPVGTKEGNQLISQLKGCPKGAKGWQDFENIGTEIFRYLFEDNFINYSVRIQSPGANGHLRRDLIINNNFKESSSFWGRIFDKYNSKVIVVDFKNFEMKLSQNDFYTPTKYLGISFGNFAIVISRFGIDVGAKIIQKKLLSENTLIVSVNDSDLVEMIKLKMKGKDPIDVLDNLVFELLSES